MFTENIRRRGRPEGQTAQGAAAKQRLYEAAIALILRQGYEGATLRELAEEAGVSVGLVYRYFPTKRAIVLALYQELSAEFVRKTREMHPGKWRDRFLFALSRSLEVSEPHRSALRALVPAAFGSGDEGLLAESAAASRLPVQRVFEDVVAGSTDAPSHRLAKALGRLLYLLHLAVLLWWLLDRSPNQRATAALVSVIGQILPSAALAIRLPPVRRFLLSADELVGEGLFTNWAGGPAAA